MHLSVLLSQIARGFSLRREGIVQQPSFTFSYFARKRPQVTQGAGIFSALKKRQSTARLTVTFHHAGTKNSITDRPPSSNP